MSDSMVSFERKENYLLITGSGERNDLSLMVESTKKIYEAILHHHAERVLLDYRLVKFNVPLTNAFDMIRIYESKMPTLKTIHAAVVVGTHNTELASFWKNTAQKRGFNFMVFTNFSKAEDWLLEQGNA